MLKTHTSPETYSSIPWKDISVTHVPADSPNATKIIIVAFNRPQKYNAVNENLLLELETVYNLVDADERVRTIVLTGAGKAFCAGADLEAAASPSPLQIATKPTIVALNGPAAGFGLTITLPAAIRIAWSGAKVGIPFSRRGLTLESCSAFFLPRLIGLSNAMHLATAGSTHLASDPLVSGLFSKLLPTPQETVEYAIGLAVDIAENTSVVSTKMMRDMMAYCPATPEETNVLDWKVFISVVGSKDNVEGVKSFMQKRKPEFSGKMDTSDFPVRPWWGAGRAGADAQIGGISHSKL